MWQAYKSYRAAWRLRHSDARHKRIWGLTEPSRTGWDRDLAIRELTSYYEFLQRLYLPPNAILYPPNGGWSDLPEGSQVEDTARVSDFLRHIPYLSKQENDGGCCGGEWTILYKSVVRRYTDFDIGPDGLLQILPPEDGVIYPIEPSDDTVFPPTEPRWKTILFQPYRWLYWKVYVWYMGLITDFRDRTSTLIDWEREPPRHMVIIADQGHRDGNKLLLDTQAGQWIIVDADHDWTTPTGIYALDELFPILKDNFNKMKYIPEAKYPGGMTVCVDGMENEEDQRTKDILRRCGWPGEKWNRAKFDKEFDVYDLQEDSESEAE